MSIEKNDKSKYYLFIDECGDHNLAKHDIWFPVFTLCGIRVSWKNLNALNKAVEELKIEIFGTKYVVIHSVNIRKWLWPFSVLADEALRMRFFEELRKYWDEIVLMYYKLYDSQKAA